ncbi:MAG TPA: hypothetical protein VFI95_20150 [Terriglobales bacterium]|nr:hypothetical protein [Terriglobales bacterium]
MQKELQSGPFLWIDALPPQRRDADYDRLRRGEVITDRLQTLDQGHIITVPDGLIHHWIGVVFIPGASLEQTIRFLQDYDNQYKSYAPEVQRSKLLSRNGNDFRVYLQLRKKKVVTVVLNTDYDVHYAIVDRFRAVARSYSTRLAELENPGQKDEREKPVGDDSGFMWRLDSYWRFWEKDGGTFVQLEAISLTRDIPSGLGWLVRPFITSIPQESLAFTLSHTRKALSDRAGGGIVGPEHGVKGAEKPAS